MQMSDDMRYDIRLVDHHLGRGRISREELAARLEALPDTSDRALRLQVRVSSVGVTLVRARASGETE